MLLISKVGKFGIDLIPSKHRPSIADTDTDTFYLQKQLMYLRSAGLNTAELGRRRSKVSMQNVRGAVFSTDVSTL